MTKYIIQPGIRAIGLSLLMAIVALFTACDTTPTPPEMLDNGKLPDIFPDYIGVTIPAEIAPMNFNVADEDKIKGVYVSVKGSVYGDIHTYGKWVDFDADQWHAFTELNRGGVLTFDVYTLSNDDKWQRYKSFEMYVSKYPLRDYGITYRKIAPGYETFSKTGIYQRALGSFDETPILEETAVNGQCLNCHYANRGNPAQFSLHVRGANGGTIINTPEGVKYLNTRTDVTPGSCTYGYWHPDGRYCAYSINRIYQNFYVSKDRLIEPWDAKSDLAVLDTKTNQLILSNLLSTEDCETTPAFSADGKKIYFCKAKKVNMPAEYDQLRYSLCSIDFDSEKGQFGNKIDTVLNADELQKSVCLARPSYDGKYLMYCLVDYGTTPINRAESDLWIMDLATGQTRCMSEVNSNETDAYHNFNSDSRWFLFGSKRGDSLYSNVYLSCLNDNGVATKPFLLPQRNPRKYYGEALHSFNAPDFTTVKVDLDAINTHDMVMNQGTQQVTVAK